MKSCKPQHFDVIVIGAGPAGSMAAIEAAKGGLSVAIIEKVSLPRRKVCAGGLVKRAVKLIPDNIHYPIEQQCHAIGLHTDHQDMQFLTKQQNLVTMVCRSAFDNALITHAKGLGVQIWDDTQITNISSTTNEVCLQSHKKSFSCAYLVFAEGAMAKLSNKFWHDDRILLPALEADVFPSPKNADRYQHAVFDFSIINGGYAWVFPKGDHLSIGLGILNKTYKVCLQQAFDDYLEKLGLSNSHIKNRKGFIIPLSPRSEPLIKKRMLLVGDTAGLADPITAEGLTHAIQSGMGAGQAIAQAFDNTSKVADLYQTQTIQPILDELHVARLLAKVIYHPNDTLRNMLFTHYGERLCKGMAQLIAGERSYASSLNKYSFLKKVVFSFKS